MRSVVLMCAALLAACDTISRDAAMLDSARVIPDSATGTVALDTGAVHYGATGRDSAAGQILVDTSAVTVFPARPRVGGVIVALLAGDSTMTARCTWKASVIPCHHTTNGVRAFIPIPAGDSAGTFALTIDAPGARVTRQVTVDDHDFGRELILLSDSIYALVRRRADIARDARAVRQVLSAVSREPRWTGRWREPAREREKTSPYGIARFYARASDSSRSIPLGPSIRAPGGFGADTLRDIDLPGWRHAGVDIARFSGSIVSSPAGGLVADVGQYALMGRTVLIDHGLGVFTAFFHLDTALVRRGDLVDAGEQIGRVGKTGLATGPHLHYGVYVNGRDVDPALWHDAIAWMQGNQSVARGRDTTRAAKGARDK
ncbi:MAG: M23 family metallopeptidase [Gemmatimonadaceae bacterium]